MRMKWGEVSNQQCLAHGKYTDAGTQKGQVGQAFPWKILRLVEWDRRQGRGRAQRWRWGPKPGWQGEWCQPTEIGESGKEPALEERLMILISGVLHLVRWLDMQVEISNRQLRFTYKRGYMAVNDSSWGTQIGGGWNSSGKKQRIQMNLHRPNKLCPSLWVGI